MNEITVPTESHEDADSYNHPHLKWTIMVYIAGDNSLSANSIALMQELESVPASHGVRVLAGYDSQAYFHKGARYLEIQHHRYQRKYPMDWGLHNDMVYPEGHIAYSPDFCNDKPATIKSVFEPTAKAGLSRFLKWALRKHRAERYMLILFGHGVLAAGNTFLSDTTPPSFLRLPEFTEIIKTHFGETNDKTKPHLHILGCDNCVMNSIEAAYDIRNHVDFMIGSQDLMLAVGWPFKKIIGVVQANTWSETKTVAHDIIAACARRLLDYSLMDRSSEQSVCDLTILRNDSLKDAIKALAEAMKKGLYTDEHTGRVRYPEIRDAIRLARLEAQSYWDETFVDLYDFCELLLQRAQWLIVLQNRWFKQFSLHFFHWEVDPELITAWFLKGTEAGRIWLDIAGACIRVLHEFSLNKPNKGEGVVPYSYYVGSQLQYSHGLSIYFPWTMPEDPIIFDPPKRSHTYPPSDYKLKTAFDEYQDYYFPSSRGTDWVGFLRQFFKATLRNVRVMDYAYVAPTEKEHIVGIDEIRALNISPVDLQKSGPDTGEQDDCRPARIKNYPRRFYLSPEDCKNKCGEDLITNKRCIPYLGWRIRGIVAEVIGLPVDYPEAPQITDASADVAPES
jgi:hypothetical protein